MCRVSWYKLWSTKTLPSWSLVSGRSRHELTYPSQHSELCMNINGRLSSMGLIVLKTQFSSSKYSLTCISYSNVSSKFSRVHSEVLCLANCSSLLKYLWTFQLWLEYNMNLVKSNWKEYNYISFQSFEERCNPTFTIATLLAAKQIK